MCFLVSHGCYDRLAFLFCFPRPLTACTVCGAHLLLGPSVSTAHFPVCGSLLAAVAAAVLPPPPRLPPPKPLSPPTALLLLRLLVVPQDRIAKARDEFVGVVSDNQLQDAAILVLANKQDMPGALSKEELTKTFDMAT